MKGITTFNFDISSYNDYYNGSLDGVRQRLYDDFATIYSGDEHLERSEISSDIDDNSRGIEQVKLNRCPIVEFTIIE